MESLRNAPRQRPVRPHGQLLPTLFDRLRDDAPGQATEAAADYTANAAGMREIIRRDLALLLGTTQAHASIDPLRHPEAAASTLNFGVPPLAGADMARGRWVDIERAVRQAILAFEPRLRPDTLSVLPLADDGAGNDAARQHLLRFEIRAHIDLQPYPLALTVQSAVDLESRRLRVVPA